MKFLIYFINIFISMLSCTNSSEKNKAVLIDSVFKQAENKTDTIPIIEINEKNNNRVLYDSVYSRTSNLEKKISIVSIFIVYKQYKIVIESKFLKDSVSVDESNMFNPIPIAQKIFFYNNQKLNTTFIYPAKKIIQKTQSGQPVEMLDNVLMSAGIIQGKKGELFIIGGYGGCNDCSEFEGYFTLEGKSLDINYRTKSEVYISTGNINKTISTYQLNDEELNKKKYSWVRIY